jgi:hypothetical protein
LKNPIDRVYIINKWIRLKIWKVFDPNLEIKQPVIADYNIIQEKSIKYLIDYSKFLNKVNFTDSNILQWQVENSNLLKQNGIKVDSNKTVKKVLI